MDCVPVRSKRRLMVRRLCLGAALAGAGLAAGCDSSTSATPPSAVVPTSSSGPVQISFLGANPPPGSTISGCGANPTGCQGRLSMTFRLRSNASGHLRAGAVYLFDATGIDGCLGMMVSPTDLTASASVETTVRVDIANQFCPMPLVVDRMVFTIYDEASLRSEQRFELNYSFLP